MAAWISGRLPARELESLERHADRCPQCLQVLAAIGRICADPHSRALVDGHGTPLLSDWALLAGAPEAVGRYALVEVIGRGGFGVVYGATDELLVRDVAIKALAAIDRDGSLIAEARALAAIEHPGVVRVFDVVETAGRVYLVMERIRGETLRQWQRRHGHDTAAVVDVYLRIASALAAVHRAGIVHGDIKPDNVLIAEDGRVVLVDFGLALAHGDHGMAARGGTPRYLAPEATAGVLGPKSDQFSFCVAMYEALCGALPGDEPRRTASPRVRAVLRRGRSELSAGRWPDMDALAHALRRATARRAAWWPAAMLVLATGGTAAAWNDEAPVVEDAAATTVAAAPDDASTRVGSQPLDLAIAARLRGDYIAAEAALRPIVEGTVPTTALLQTRARHELGRVHLDAGTTGAYEHLVAAHDAAAAQSADLLAATIAIDLAQLRAESPALVDDARVWLRTAEAELRRIDIDPARHGGIAAARASIDEAAGDFDAAAEGFARASTLLAEQDPVARIAAHIGWGSALGRRGEHARGLEKLAEAHILCDNAGVVRGRMRIEARRAAGSIHGNARNFDAAAAELQMALDAYAGSPGSTRDMLGALHTDLGIYHLQRNDRDAAFASLSRAVELSPTSWSAHANLAIHYSQAACHPVLETPDCEPEAAALGLAHELRALELAREQLGDEHPKFATMQSNTARHLLATGQLVRARDLYVRASDRLLAAYGAEAQQLLNPLYGLTEVSVRLDDREAAVEAAKRLQVVAHGEAIRGQGPVVTVLDYAVGRTLVWNDPRDADGRALVERACAQFGDAPPNDAKLIELWFRRATPSSGRSLDTSPCATPGQHT